MRTHTFWQTIANWIVPQSCELCRAPSLQINLCIDCLKELPWSDNSLILPADTMHPVLFSNNNIKGVIAPFRYEHPTDHFIHAFKYQKQIHWAYTLAYCISRQWAFDFPSPDAWIPIPLHASRYRERGFNQSQLLARALSKLRGGKVNNALLKRVRTSYSVAQHKLSADERLSEVIYNFAVNISDHKNIPKRVCLVDDVLTTGATLSSAANALHLAGVEEIYAVVIARTHRNI